MWGENSCEVAIIWPDSLLSQLVNVGCLQQVSVLAQKNSPPNGFKIHVDCGPNHRNRAHAAINGT